MHFVERTRTWWHIPLICKFIDMEKQNIAVAPEIAQKIIDMQVQHDLPINIIIGEEIGGLQLLTFEYHKIDYSAFAWMMSATIKKLVTETVADDMDDDDLV